ncbi:hypothetical protein [Leptospira andrefontaineae]|uniref:Uncharacterized protein n=1 Tax=Leptospira andrefontaineae TaxID=2484976 RepID=A0A4R9H7C1_9LEPT|nr:hypothetical protein [Leptospira andrefontaineae]TGK41520.1 hypothetical protein EHO65_08865 [Leptospira andrefontaineae]
MNDTYSFFRYTLPGVLFLIELSILVIILDWDGVVNFIYSENNKLNGLNLTLVVLFLTSISFGIGAILSLFYRIFSCLKIDYSSFLKKVKENEFIDFDKLTPTIPAYRDIDLKKYGWVIVTSFWFERVGSSELIKGAVDRAQSLSNLLHNSAACLAGSFILPFILIFYIYRKGGLALFSCCGVILSFVVTVAVIYAHHKSYLDAKFTLKAFVEIILWNALKNEKAGKISKRK